jgi:hypothetical protein
MHVFDRIVRAGVHPAGAGGAHDEQDLPLEGAEALEVRQERGPPALAACRHWRARHRPGSDRSAGRPVKAEIAAASGPVVTKSRPGWPIGCHSTSEAGLPGMRASVGAEGAVSKRPCAVSNVVSSALITVSSSPSRVMTKSTMPRRARRPMHVRAAPRHHAGQPTAHDAVEGRHDQRAKDIEHERRPPPRRRASSRRC